MVINAPEPETICEWQCQECNFMNSSDISIAVFCSLACDRKKPKNEVLSRGVPRPLESTLLLNLLRYHFFLDLIISEQHF